ncbi:hypothetical protein ED733_000989 [Metarhizium rileyi]|uniref:Uncharacterized protein n=1 Tax=Metarhizium rileyi (strain RCEF 4871) TaxID=1649241 RepID=A0A5C6GDQ6_METRR|nr:hypothetical protein ED733_000989 [Metarhizium rileyi]
MLPVFAAALLGTALAATTRGQCADNCTAEWRRCQAASNANQSYCASTMIQCLGYSPSKGGDTDIGVPTTWAKEPEYAPAMAVDQTECARKCSEMFFACTIQFAWGDKDKNNPFPHHCIRRFNECAGFLVFKETLKLPVACMITTTTTAAPASTVDPCAQMCLSSWHSCKAGENVEISHCASRLTGCLGYSPFGDDLKQVSACKSSATGSTLTTSVQPAQTTSAI